MRSYYVSGNVQRVEAVQNLSGGLVLEESDQEAVQHALGFVKVLARIRGDQRLLVARHKFWLIEVVLKRYLCDVVDEPNGRSLAARPVNTKDYVVRKYSANYAGLALAYERLRLKLLCQRLSA